MYALIQNGEVAKYPYTVEQLRQDNPQTSFPRNPTMAALESYGVYGVLVTGQPEFDRATQKVVEGTPVRERRRNPDGTFVSDDPSTPENEAWRWVQTWEVVQLTAEEQQAALDTQAAQVRSERNSLLTASDWTQLADSTADKEAWAAYRQALRDITTQAGFPWTIDWPEAPTN